MRLKNQLTGAFQKCLWRPYTPNSEVALGMDTLRVELA